jgi:16S rRNA (adenine1518-N6/adenine1519-N6)-dimethyltransferase
MTDPRAVLKRAGLSPKRSFGQNFLVSPHAVESIANACAPDPSFCVVELGAGTGVLTRALASRAARVVGVERDRDLVPVLRKEFREQANVEIVEGDAATIDPTSLVPEPRVLAGNLPYQITGRLLELATIHADGLARAVFMVQLEVAQRLAASPGTKDYGALTVFVNAAFQVTKLFDVSPGSFYPPPDVTSAVVLLEPRRPRLAEETETFRALVKGAFGARRKTLRNAWSKVADPSRIASAAEASGISLDARGETLGVEAYARMARNLGI